MTGRKSACIRYSNRQLRPGLRFVCIRTGLQLENARRSGISGRQCVGYRIRRASPDSTRCLTDLRTAPFADATGSRTDHRVSQYIGDTGPGVLRRVIGTGALRVCRSVTSRRIADVGSPGRPRVRHPGSEFVSPVCALRGSTGRARRALAFLPVSDERDASGCAVVFASVENGSRYDVLEAVRRP